MRTKQYIEKSFESMLWRSRLIVLAAVVSSMLASISMFFMATVDAYYMLSHLLEYASPLEADVRNALRAATVTHVVEIIDGYLLATVLLIFSLGLYELFISKIDQAEGEEVSSKVLVIHSLDDLKARLSKVVLMILVVKYFEHAIKMDFASPEELLYLAGGIALIGLALYLTHAADSPHSKHE